MRNIDPQTRAELLDQLAHLDARERGLRAQRSDVTYRLEQVLRERDRLRHHLASLDQDESAA